MPLPNHAHAKIPAHDKRISRGPAYAKARRQRLASDHMCINGSTHGAATHGVRCGWCHDVNRRGLSRVIELPRHPRPPGYIPRPREGKGW